MAVTVVIVDDNAGFRAMARVVLREAGYVVVGEAGDAAEGLTVARRVRPDWVLLDVNLPDSDGFRVAARLAEDEDAPVVVLTTGRDVSEYEPPPALAHVRGLIAKERLSADALEALLA
jgi:DNA-binding NarL/FixJ family response regulator